MLRKPEVMRLRTRPEAVRKIREDDRMNLTKIALKRPVSCVLIILALAVFSISSLLGFKLELTPSMEVPMLYVLTVYPGADPETVDELVTSVVEDAGSALSGVDSVMAQSMENTSMVLFSYEYGVDIDDCYADLRSALDTASLQLPDDAETPTVIEMKMDQVPCMYISATEIGDIDLLKVIEESVVPDLEKLSGVAQVQVSGGTEDYIKVELNETLMNQYGLTMDGIAQMMSGIDFSYPAGSVAQGSQDVSITTSMDYNTVQRLKELPLTTKTGSVITLQDVAWITESSKEASGISRYNGQDNVGISIQSKSSYGTVNVCKDVSAALEKIGRENPSIDFQIVYDTSESIVDSLWSVAQTLIAGVILSMIVLFLFFGDFKASLIVGASMPVSLFVTLVMMNFAGYSLNIVTMGAMVIAIGMMVDSSIVVVESCFRLKEKHADFKEAALAGTKIVTASIVASTITTIVVYVPLATMDGLSGQLMAPLGFTIVFAMIASLLVALTLVPLCYAKLKPVEKKDIPINKFLRWFTGGYKKVLRKLLHKRALVILFSVVIVIVALWMGLKLNKELMPSADEGTISVSVSFRSGTRMETVDEEMKVWTDIVEAEEDVESYSLSVSDAYGSIDAYLKEDRKLSTAEVVDKWNTLASEMPGMDITVSASGASMSSMMSGSSYDINLQGTDMDILKDFSEQLEEEFLKVDGVIKVDNSTSGDSVGAKVKVDSLKAMQYGLTPIQVGMTLNSTLSGKTALTVTREGAEYDVILEYPDGVYDNMNDLMNLNLQTAYGTMVPLRDVAEIVYEEEQEYIMKQDGKYQLSLTSSITSDKFYEARDAIDNLVAQTEFPSSVEPANGMQMEMMNEEFAALIKAILTAIFLVFLVMAIQFESPRFSFMVMMCIPFAMIGSFMFLFVTNSTISMVSLMGFLMLMGIVVNNGILYVDSANQLREEMDVEDALVETGAIRLRPILMTSLTTILSMIPMGIGFGTNGEMMKGMALVIMGGLIASTALTLILMPTIYLIIDKRSRKNRRGERKAMKEERRRLKKAEED